MKACIVEGFQRTGAIRAVALAAFTLVATPLFAITIDGESRLTEEQFAKKHAKSVADVKKTFVATGKLECRDGRKGHRLTAQLTGQNDVIVTAAHGFIDTATCKRKIRPDQCLFKAHDGQRPVTRGVQLIAIGGIRCEPGARKGADDWAVLKLAAPIATITPYGLGQWNTQGSVTNVGVLSVSAQSQDFYLNGTRKSDVKTIDDCTIKSFSVFGTAAMLGTNCDVSPGNSGGALLVGGSSGSHGLLAISIGAVAMPADRKRRNAPQDGAYNDRTWRAAAVPLAGAFRAALERATGRAISTFTPLFPVGGMTVSAPLTPGATPPPAGSNLFFPPLPPPCEAGAAEGDGSEACRKP